MLEVGGCIISKKHFFLMVGIERYPGLYTIYSKKVVVCQLCFDSGTELKQCLIRTPKNNPANVVAHLSGRHTRLAAKKFWDKVEARDNVRTMAVAAGMHNFVVPISQRSLEADVSNEAENLLYRFFNTANVSMNQTNNVHLHELLQLLVAKGSVFKKGQKNIRFTPHRYKVQETKAFLSFVNFVSHAISSAREFYVEATGKHIPFLSVGHDGWDSKRRDILGVTIHLVHPVNWVTIALPIGLKYDESKKAEDMALQINKILTR